MKKNFSDTKYPQFIKNTPCGNDLFEGQSHQRIADCICEILRKEEDCNVIGIDGGWGSGKSNLVTLVERSLEKENYHFFIYDAWGHQDDLQRRSILEELTDDLTNGKKEKPAILNNSKWQKKLKDLLAKKREVETKSIPKLSCGIILSALAIILTPVLNILTSDMTNKYWRVVIMCIPLIMILSLFTIFLVRNLCICKCKRFEWAIKETITKLFNIYTDRQKEDTTFETISEEEPSSRKFKQWLEEINDDLENNKLIIVFDNMDRLPCQKVQELWAAIHTFFSDSSYSNIRVIVPFDREHIISAFKSEDIIIKPSQQESIPEKQKTIETISRNKYYGNDFINKTFNVIYRVSPPTMSNWKKYFNGKWLEAFGEPLEPNSLVTQIYDTLTEMQTPRKIIAFINEFVAIKQVFALTPIPNQYTALFIFGKSRIIKDPDKEILIPSYLGAMDFMFKNDKKLPDYISALYYQLSPDNAIDIVYTDKIKWALDNNDAKFLNEIKTLSKFDALIENAITLITNIPNAVIALNSTIKDEELNSYLKIWNCIYKKTGSLHHEKVQEYQKILLQKIIENEEYLNSIIKDFYHTDKFDVITFCESIDQLSSIPRIDPFICLLNKEIEPKEFIRFVESTKGKYLKYKISCNENELNSYLSGLDIYSFSPLNSIQYINDDYDLSAFLEYLHKLIDANANDVTSLKELFKTVAKIEKPITKKIDDLYIYTHFAGLTENDPFYLDLLCMRISRTNSFNPAYASVFDSALSKTDDQFVDKVAEKIEYYMPYGDILLNLKNMNQPLYKDIARKLTEKPYGDSFANIVSVLNNYDTIIDNIDIDIAVIIKRINAWAKQAVEKITISNLNKIPIKFFKDTVDIKNVLVSHCHEIAINYLKSKNIKEWEASIQSSGYDYQLLEILQPNGLQDCFDAFKSCLEKYAKGEISSLSKKTMATILNWAEQHNRQLLAEFNRVRDIFCSNSNMSAELFDYYGEWLFKYSKLADKQESLRAIFTPEVLNKEVNISLILAQQEIMKKVIDKAGEEAIDFKDKISELLNSKYSKDSAFIDFAKSIGIERTKSETEEIEQ